MTIVRTATRDRIAGSERLQAAAPALLRDLMLCHHAQRDADRLRSVLGRVAACCHAMRILVLTLDSDDWTCEAEWHAPGLPPAQRQMQKMPLTGFESAFTQLRRHRVVDPGPTDRIADTSMRHLLQMMNIDRLLALPFTVDDSLSGALVLCFAADQPVPDAEDQELLGLVADGLNAQISRQRTDQALETARRDQARAMAQLRATLAAMPELILEFDADGRCIDFHCNQPELLATSPGLNVNRTLEETLPADVAQMQRGLMARARRDGAAESAPYVLGEGDARRWFHLTVAYRPASDGDAGKDGYLFRIRDITEERMRRDWAQVLARVVNEISVMVVLFDPDMRILWANPAFEAHIGQPLARLIGQRIRDFTDLTATDPQVIRDHDNAVRTRQRYEGVAKRQINDDLRAVELLLEPFHREDGTFRGFISIQRDITDRLAAETEARRLSGELAAAHQLMNDAVEALPDGLVVYDRDENMVLWNRRFAEINAPIANMIGIGKSLSGLVAAARASGMIEPGAPSMDLLLDRSRMTGNSCIEQSLTDGRVLRFSGRHMASGGYVVLCSDISDIRNAQWRLSNIIDGARVASWDHDITRRMLTVNEYWFAMLGEPVAPSLRISDREWLKRIHPDDRDRMLCRLDSVASGKSSEFEDEYRLRHHDGHWVHLMTRGRGVARDAAGRVLQMSGIDIDVTENRQSQEQLQAVLEAAAVGTWQVDKPNRRVIVDEAYASQLGYAAHELQSMTQAEFEGRVHPDDLTGIHQRLRAAHEAGRDRVDFEFRMRHRDGSWRWIMSKTRISEWGEDGLPLREAGVHLDVTEARLREAALAEARDALAKALYARQHAETRMSDIAAVSDDWFWELDSALRFSFISDGFARATGYPVAACLGQTPRELGIDRMMPAQTWAEVEAALDARRQIGPFIYTIVNHDSGHKLSARVTGKPVLDQNGRFAGYRGVGADVTQLIRVAERAEAANRAKSSFLATMSHELRTPMTAVLGLTELMQDRVDDPELCDMLKTIRDSGTSLLSVLDDILDLAKIEAGKLTTEIEPFEPAQLARRCRNLLGPRATAAGLELSVTTGPGCDGVRLGDPHRMLQILNNLLGNAIKFTERGGVRLQIAALPDDDTRLRLVVEDDGIGMAPEQVARVFDEFEQAESSIARRFGGTGLGLSITRRLVALLGGELHLHSAPGKGTRVEVTLPASRVKVTAAASAGNPTAAQPLTETSAREAGAFVPADFQGLRVLVADDNATNRRILQAMLTALGVNTTLAEDGRAALSSYRPDRFDLLMLDISMPELDGPAALQAMRSLDKRENRPSPPALAVTAHAMSHQIEEFLAHGFDGHLPKPFGKASLTAALSHVLAKRRASVVVGVAPDATDPRLS